MGVRRIGMLFERVLLRARRCDVPWAVHFPYASYAYEDEFRKGEVNPPPALQTTTQDAEERCCRENQVDNRRR